MDNELRNHKKSDTMKWWLTLIAFLLMGATILGLVTGFIVPNQNKQNEEPSTEQTESVNNGNSSEFNTELVSTQNVRLMSTGPMTRAATGNYAEQTLVATVLPATAKTKAVDWSVSWAEEANVYDVTEYVTVTPTSDGSTTATIRCYQAFPGNVIVTVTTRENGYQADCIVTFVGVPTDISVDGNATYSGDAYKLGIGQTYTFNTNITNPFNIIGEDYQNLEVSLNGVGSVILGYMEHYNQSGSDKWYDTSDQTVALDTLKDNFITVSISNGVITVNTIKSIESYYSSAQRMDGGRTTGYHDKFRSYVDDCYFTLTVTEPVSGVSETIKLRFDQSVVTGVSTEKTQIYF